MTDKDTQLIYEAYLNEDRYAREHPEDQPDIDYAQRARAEDAMRGHNSMAEVAYEFVDYTGADNQSLEIFDKLVNALLREEGELHGHIIAWKNDVRSSEAIPEGLKKFTYEKFFPAVERWAKDGGNEAVRRGLKSYVDVIDYLVVMEPEQRMELVNGPNI